jgi:hypothetical protein
VTHQGTNYLVYRKSVQMTDETDCVDDLLVDSPELDNEGAQYEGLD